MKNDKPKTSFMDRAKQIITEFHNAVDVQPPPPPFDPNEYYNEEDLYIGEDEDSPYENASWGDNWFCIRCGSKLCEMEPESWKLMKRRQSLLYVCSNDKCCHHNAPLTLHHPFGTDSAPGDSYSISWIK